MNQDQVARNTFDTECAARITDMSRFSYEQYLERGRGIVHVYADVKSPDNFSFEYSTEGQTDNYLIDLETYDPEQEMLVLMDRPDGTLYQFTYTFLDPTQRPKYLHNLQMFP
jgi:hypothetical protein